MLWGGGDAARAPRGRWAEGAHPPPPPPPRPQLFLGPAGSGAPFHFHKDAVNLLLVGRKSWFLTPPSSASYATVPAAVWVAHGMERPGGGDLLTCIQEEGDAMYVPSGWGHAVLNLEAAAGVALEWSSPWVASI